jgi:hypothetical protein
MMGTNGGRRSARIGVAGAAVAAGLIFGSAMAYADPTDTPAPPPAPAPSSAPSAGSVYPSALPPTTAPAPKVAVEGGAAAGAAASADAATAAAAGATQGDVLDQLAEEYAVGAGGGQLSNLLKTALKLRAMGFKPSKKYLDEIQEAMTHRPNQLPLIGALKDTIAYQQKIQAQMQILQQAQAKNANGAVMGAGAAPGAANPANVAPGAVAPGMAAPPAPAVILPTTP